MGTSITSIQSFLISSYIKFRFLIIVANYLTFDTFSNNLFTVLMSRFYLTFW
jgi:hypothetical protein